MSNRMFQGVIYQMKDTIGRVIGVTDEMGVVVACSELNQIDSIKDGVQAERMSNSASFIRNGYTFKGFTNSKNYISFTTLNEYKIKNALTIRAFLFAILR